MIDEIMEDFAIKYSTPIDIVEAAIGDDCEIDIEDFDPASDETYVLSMLDELIPEGTPAEFVYDDNGYEE